MCLLTISYIYRVNYNVAFLTLDEFTNATSKIGSELTTAIATGRTSHLIGAAITSIFRFEIPSFFSILPRFFSIVFLYLSLILIFTLMKIPRPWVLVFSSCAVLMHQIDWQHNGMIAYFGTYNLYFAAFWGAFYIHEMRAKGGFRCAIVTLLLLVSFASELFIGLSLVYFAIEFWTRLPIRSWSKFFNALKSPFFYSISIFGLVFCIAQFVVQPAASAEMKNYLTGSFWQFGIGDVLSGTLLYTFFSIPFVNSAGLSTSVVFVLSGLLFVFSFLAVIVSLKEIRKPGMSRWHQTRNSLVILMVCLLWMPQLLMSLQPMKLRWILDGSSTRYIFSWYSWLAFFFLVSLILWTTKWGLRAMQSGAAKCVMLSVVLLLMFLSAYHNISFVSTLRKSKENWLFVRDISARSMSNVYLPEDLLRHPYILPIDEIKMRRYVAHVFGKQAIICRDMPAYFNSKTSGFETSNFKRLSSLGAQPGDLPIGCR